LVAKFGGSIVEILIPLLVAVVAGGLSYLASAVKTRKEIALSEKRLRRDYQLEFAAETVARSLLNNEHWSLRSFSIIKHHLGGFEDEELRKVLIRAGAIRFESVSGIELWGLLERNNHRLGVPRIAEEPGFRDGD